MDLTERARFMTAVTIGLATPDHWLRMQLAYDLAKSRELDRKIKVKRIAAV